MKALKKLEAQLENANNRYSLVLRKKYYNYSEEVRVYAQMDTWLARIDKLEGEISALKKQLNNL
jgi:predicted RNase H-like nuclease (RuvC/YqgF family)